MISALNLQRTAAPTRQELPLDSVDGRASNPKIIARLALFVAPKSEVETRGLRGCNRHLELETSPPVRTFKNSGGAGLKGNVDAFWRPKPESLDMDCSAIVVGHVNIERTPHLPAGGPLPAHVKGRSEISFSCECLPTIKNHGNHSRDKSQCRKEHSPKAPVNLFSQSRFSPFRAGHNSARPDARVQ